MLHPSAILILQPASCANFPNLSNDVASLEILLYYNNRNGCSHPPGKKGRSPVSDNRKQLIELIESEKLSENEVLFILQFFERVHQQD